MSTTFQYAQNFNILPLRPLWITNQLKAVFDIITDINFNLLQAMNEAKVYYNTALDYNDTGYSNALDTAVSNLVTFDTNLVIPFRQSTTLTTKYDTVEVGLKTFVQALLNQGQNSNPPSDFAIMVTFLQVVRDFYYKSDDNNVAVNKAILLSMDELKIHLELFLLITDAIKKIISSIKRAKQWIYIVNSSSTSNPLYQTFNQLETHLNNTAYPASIAVVNQIERVLIYNLQNSIANTTQNFIDLRNLVHTLVLEHLTAHNYFQAIFYDPGPSYFFSNGQYAIIQGNTLPTLTP